MLKTTTAGAAAILLLGASAAMAQETFPPFVVLSVETTANVVVQPAIAAGDPCVDALQALRAVPLPRLEVNVIQGGILVFVMSARRKGAILTCSQGPIDILPPTPPSPTNIR